MIKELEKYDNYTKEDLAQRQASAKENGATRFCIVTSGRKPENADFKKILDMIDEEEILKTICIFRIILPKAMLRYAGGRTTRLSKENQKCGIIAGINSVLVGNYLTTTGSNADDDKNMLSKLGLKMEN